MQYLYLDESGIIHKNSPDRFFVIGGILTKDHKHVKKKFVNLNHELKEKYNMAINEELKGTHLEYREKRDILFKIQEIEDAYIVVIVVDKEKVKLRLNDERIYYNYFVGKLIEYLINKKALNANIFFTLQINLDKRTMRIGDKNSLANYLNLLLNIDRGFDIDVKVEYIDSSSNYMIQLADIVCNTFWSLGLVEELDKAYQRLNKGRVKLIQFKEEV